MNAARWESTTDPDAMIDRLRGPVGERKQRLLICALARHLWDILPAEGRHAVEVAERLVDGECDEDSRVRFESQGQPRLANGSMPARARARR